MSDEPFPHALVEQLVGQEVWHVTSGYWPAIGLILGDRVRRTRALPVTSSRHPEEFRTHQGAFELYIYCAWRLVRDGDLAVASHDSERGTSPLPVLPSLVGKRITALTCVGPVGDLALTFQNGDELQLFADHANDVENWILWTPESSLEVGPGKGWEQAPATR